jgi:hypothetical protein
VISAKVPLASAAAEETEIAKLAMNAQRIAEAANPFLCQRVGLRR